MNVHVQNKDVTADLPLPLLQQKLEEAEARAAEAKSAVEKIEQAITKRIAETVDQARKLADKEFGSIRVVVDGVEVKHDIPKNVSWDTKALLAAATKLSCQGMDPYQFLDFKLTISEKKYEMLPKDVLSLVRDARTIKPGKPKFEITVTESK